ncbi:hypothetical protein LTR04_006178 [Oleoguttula sp. CCFEE 6159]|nr:hypothetical protein LTR04_006178 [Oleoguttula sp. CCFEE 6159]
MNEEVDRSPGEDALQNITPIGSGSVVTSKHGRLVPLKTKAECRAGSETIDVYVIEIPIKSANGLLNLLKDAIPGQDTVDILHLRRFAKADFLPPGLQKRFFTTHDPLDSSDAIINDEVQHPSLQRRDPIPAPSTPKLHLLICPAFLIHLEDLSAVFAKHSQLFGSAAPPAMYVVPVPALAPTSAEQAEIWSRTYWPTVYKRSNPFGPHPSILSHAETYMLSDVGYWMALAGSVARDAKERGYGPSVGCVIVERGGSAETASAKPEVVVVAGDARNCEHAGSAEVPAEGNPMGHAVMRAISLVAQKRSLQSNGTSSPHQLSPALPKKDVSLDFPLTPLEQNIFGQDNLQHNGYLCLDLEIYVTHEPCVMCSMAILHSRFGRCVFGKRMCRTGGLTADDGLSYGMFWRPELNWKFLCWEWVGEGVEDKGSEMTDGVGEDVHC